MNIHLYYNIEGFRWSSSKNEELKARRGVSFGEIILEEFVGEIANPSHPGQRLLFFERDDYIWVVPVVLDEDKVFLKTLYASRKFTKLWRRGEWESIGRR